MKFTYRSPGSGNNNNRVRIHLCCSAALFSPAGSSYVWWAGSLFICRLFLWASYFTLSHSFGKSTKASSKSKLVLFLCSAILWRGRFTKSAANRRICTL